ncbi:MAG TPA: hypothetical protein VGC99_14840 [Candidatus Tectomicrobia bacterium]
MPRGSLDRETLEAINGKLPDILGLQRLIHQMSITGLSMKLGPKSRLPIAAVCLDDAAWALAEARYALHESFAEPLWYRTKSIPPNEVSALIFGKFFADDMALRFYTAVEHLAESLVFMLGIKEADLKRYAKGRMASRASIVGSYLRKEKPDHVVTKAIEQLLDSKDYQFTVRYRNEWVHNQPPKIKGTGLTFERRTRWHEREVGGHKAHILTFGGGDEPKYTLDLLQERFLNSLKVLVECVGRVTDFFVKQLAKHDIVITDKGGSTTL